MKKSLSLDDVVIKLAIIVCYFNVFLCMPLFFSYLFDDSTTILIKFMSSVPMLTWAFIKDDLAKMQ